MTDNFCDICGQEFLCPSVVTLDACYGSIHDGERLRLELCEECFDRLYYLALDIKPVSKSVYLRKGETV